MSMRPLAHFIPRGTAVKNKPFVSARPLHLMLLPAVILLIVYNYVPMAGIVMAFQRFDIFLGFRAFWESEWVGLQNYRDLIRMGDPVDVVFNTLNIAVWKIAFGTIVPLFIALLLNELRSSGVRRIVQTVVYLPHFLSWVILGGIFRSLFSIDGLMNQFVGVFGLEPISFLQSNTWFVPVLVLTETWKEFGFGTIIYLAAIIGLDPGLYESAIIDGANRVQRARYITIPGIASTVILLLVLRLRGILRAGFDQVFNLYNPQVYETGDIIGTFVYRMGFESPTPLYDYATAIGLFQSAVSMILIIVSYWLASKFANYRIF
jgi:putative aldouronate transport system permease protein